MHKSEIPTPALVIDRDRLEQNIQTMQAFFRGRPAGLRPHSKTHKCPQIARMQVEAGALGITCAKLGEAKVMVDAGLTGILIANQVVGAAKARELARLGARAEVIAAADCAENVDELAAAARAEGTAIHLIVEVDVGMRRAGTRSAAATVALAQHIAGTPGLRFRGLMGYEGHTVFIANPDERRQAGQTANAILVEHAEAVRAAGLPVELVSAGGTGTYNICGAYPGITEVQAGSYPTMDARYHALLPEFQPALTLLTTVVSRPERGRVILDAGLKSMTHEFGLPQPIDVRGATLIKLSEEHGTVDLTDPDRDLRLGDKVSLLPTHGCTTVNLHDTFYVVRGDEVVDTWAIAARGKLQ